MKTSLAIALILVLGLLVSRRLAFAEPEPQTALQAFSARPTWRTLPIEFLEALAAKINSVETAKEFAILCENTGILDNSIVNFAHQEPPSDLAPLAAMLTGYANAMGEQEKFHEAKRALEFALLLRPRHLPAWMSMALVVVNLNDCRAAVAWADKVLDYKPDTNSDDPWEGGTAAAMTPEGEGYAADALGDPEMVGGFSEVQEQMKAVREVCSRKVGRLPS